MKKFILFIILSSLFFGSWYYYNNNNNNKKEINFYGNIDKRTVTLSFRYLGEITNIIKDEGDNVLKNEKIIFQDTSYIENSIKTLKETLKAKNEILKKYKNGYREEEIEKAIASYQTAKAKIKEINATIKRTKENYKNNLLIYNRQKELFKKGSTPKQTYTNAKSMLAISKATYEESIAILKTTKTNLKFYKANLNLLKNGYRQEDIKALSFERNALIEKINKLKIDLKKSILISPVNGVIINKFKEIGSIASPSEPVIEIANMDEIWVRTYTDESYLGLLKRGMGVFIYSDVRKKPYNGHISFISNIAEFTPKNIQTQKLRTDLVYRFRVIIDDNDGKLKQGLPVNLKLKK